jgi:hypothetical protein
MHPRRTFTQLLAALASLRLAARVLRLASQWRGTRRLRRLGRLGLLPALLVALLGRPALAAPVYPGPIFLANAPDEREIYSLATAMNPDGDFVIAWTSYGQDGDSSFDTNVYARRFAPNSDARGPAFLVNTATAGSQFSPTVAMDADGDFVIAWTSAPRVGSTLGEFNVFARRFSAAGQGGEQFPVNLTTDDYQFGPDAAMADDGSFVVTWTSYGQDGDSSSDSNVYARRFPALGPAGPELLVNQFTAGDQYEPAIALASDGDFIVAWTSQGQDGDATFDSNIYARRFPAVSGEPGDAFLVNQYTNQSQQSPDVAVDAAGNAVIAWSGEGANPNSTFQRMVFARRFPLAGAASDQFQASVANDRQDLPRVAMDADGDFVIAWSTACCESNGDLYLRQFDADGSSRDPDRLINDNDRSTPGFFDMADNAEGEFVVGWEGGFARLFRRPAVEATQTDASTLVSESGDTDTVAVALRNVPNTPVFVLLTPDSAQIALDNAAPGASIALRFEPDLSALRPQNVLVRAVPDDAAEGPHAAAIGLSATGPESGYENPPPVFTVDGSVSDSIPVQIIDDPRDQAVYSVRSSTAATNEGDSTPVVFTVLRDGGRGGANSVGYRFRGTASFGEDYVISGAPQGVSGPDGLVPFAPGQSVQRIAISIVDDQISEPNSSIIFELLAPLPTGSGRLLFPIAVVALADNDLAEVQIAQTGGSTTVVRGGAGDRFSVALRTIPTQPVTITLSPTSEQLNLQVGWGVPRLLTFPADATALQPQSVRIFTAGANAEATPSAAEQAAVTFAASSADEGYSSGARFTVDGRDATQLVVGIEVAPNAPPRIMRLFLPVVRR